MFCCCQGSTQQQHMEESRAPPTIQRFTQNQRNRSSVNGFNDSQVRAVCQTLMNQSGPMNLYRSPQRPLINQFTKRPQEPFAYHIQTLRQENRNNKVSLSRKRNDFTSRFKLLQSRISQLKTAYSEKSQKMLNISTQVNHLVDYQRPKFYQFNRVGR